MLCKAVGIKFLLLRESLRIGGSSSNPGCSLAEHMAREASSSDVKPALLRQLETDGGLQHVFVLPCALRGQKLHRELPLRARALEHIVVHCTLCGCLIKLRAQQAHVRQLKYQTFEYRSIWERKANTEECKTTHRVIPHNPKVGEGEISGQGGA